MSQILRVNQTVVTESSGLQCQVQQFLGGGTQGEVYRALLAGKAVAVKWYFSSMATPQQRSGLESLIRKRAPNDRFLWPLELVKTPDIATFGYVMALREPRYKGIVDMMKRRVDPSFRALATAGFYLADSYLQLHSSGLCYRDISFGNVFLDPDTGDVLICDNDNVTINGDTVGGVNGTPRFMAPEIVRGEARPGTQTDLYSLAVLLFYMFMLHHPLEGKKESAIRCLDLPAMNKLYGTDPLFIFDPDDHSNEPDPQYHSNAIESWPIYPRFLRDLFTRSFTKGIRDPQHGRVRETEWRTAMIRLRDSIVYCSSCSTENFYDADALSTAGASAISCWSCHKSIRLPARIRIERNIIMLNHDTKLFPHHTDSTRSYNFSAPVAEVSRHPSDPGRWGLKNLTTQSWAVVLADGTMRSVEPERSVPLAVGTKIQFGNTEGEIRI